MGLISEAESGKNKPSPNLLFALAKKYHINISWLLTGEGEKNLSEKHSFKVPDDLLELCEMAERWPEVKKVLLAELEKLKVYLADRFQDRYSADGAGEKPESKAG